MELTPEEIRILGALVEKQATTPDQYPLSTNALVTACNQKTSRDPVVDYDDRLVDRTMYELRQAGFARTVKSGRTDKHKHVLDEALGLGPAPLAVLAVLMLRGEQTPGELRTRTERYVADEIDVDGVLRDLAAQGLAVSLGRRPGQSQDRWTHAVGDAATDSAGGSTAPITAPPAGTMADHAGAPAVSAAQLSSSPAPTPPSTAKVPGAPPPAGAVRSASAPPVRPGSPTAAPSPAAVAGGPPDREAALEGRVADLEERLARIERELGL